MDIFALNLIRDCVKNKLPTLSLSGLNLGKGVFEQNTPIMDALLHCTHLRVLNLNQNGIIDIKFLENFPKLEKLFLSDNLIQSIRGIENLTNLQHLEISSNSLRHIAGLEKLINLRSLNISHNAIKDIKDLTPFLRGFGKSNNAGVKTQLLHDFELNAFDNPLTSPPIEILYHGNDAILNYFDELEKQGTEYLYEAKMMILGQPRAGKTSFARKLGDSKSKLTSEEETTRGIVIKRLDFPIKDLNGNDRKFFYNLWDFGGQQIYHTTHQFFLTHRTLYALVIDTGKDNLGNDDATINYWLQAVELLGGSSPILLIKNEKNDRRISVDIAPKRARFKFLREEYCIDLNALIPGTNSYSIKRLKQFADLKDDIENQLRHLPLVGYAMPKNWVTIRNELQKLSINSHFINKNDFINLCVKHDVTQYKKQMELSKIFHDLGVFLHFQDYSALDELVILQNTWATDAVFAVLDNIEVQENKGRFSDNELSYIWENKGYEPIVHKKLLALMIKFQLCYLVDKSDPKVYIVPEMLSDSPPDEYQWSLDEDLPLQYGYDFMPRGILTQFIVRMNRNISIYKGEQIVWKTGVKIDGNTLSCPNTEAEITEAWNSKQLNVRTHGAFAKNLMTRISQEIDQLNSEYFRQVSNEENDQKSYWYKKIPCNCGTCANMKQKHFYDYDDLLKRKTVGKDTIECQKVPFETVNITGLLEGIFSSAIEKSNVILGNRVIKIFLASSSELKAERNEFEIFIGRENKRLNDKGIFIRLEIWEDFVDKLSQTRLQDEYNKVIEACDIFVMLFFTKVGKYTAEEFEKAFNQFKATDRPAIYTYFKKAVIKSTDIDRDGTKSLWAFQDKLKELGHFQTEFENDAQLHLHFKKQLEKLYDI